MDSIRLFCLPYAGGGPHIFAPWRNRLSDEVGIYGAQLPGRGRRFSEPPLTEVEGIVEAMADAVAPLLNRPLALFGHSMGGLLAFELARSCRRRAGVEPSRLFVSGINAPQAPRLRDKIHHLDDAQFLDEISRLGGMPAEILANKEMLRLMLPTLRADFAAVETYTYRPETPLSCPIIVFGGLQDPCYQSDELDGWREQTTGRFSRHLMPGGHFFLCDSEAELLALIGRNLAQCHERRDSGS
jgi:medium-chain acyl-[acyl-carrier-protein] hydrolase